MQQQERDNGILCANGCGFFGAAATGGMCSMCWKKTMSARQVTGENSTATPASGAGTVTPQTSGTSGEKSSLDAQPASTPVNTPILIPTVPSPATTEAQPSVPAPITDVATASASPSDGQTTVEEKGNDQPAERVQKNKKRCFECSKKVGLTGITCRCTFVFCGKHRYADQHACTFDYKAADRAELAKRNPGGGVFNKMDKL